MRTGDQILERLSGLYQNLRGTQFRTSRTDLGTSGHTDGKKVKRREEEDDSGGAPAQKFCCCVSPGMIFCSVTSLAFLAAFRKSGTREKRSPYDSANFDVRMIDFGAS